MHARSGLATNRLLPVPLAEIAVPSLHIATRLISIWSSTQQVGH